MTRIVAVDVVDLRFPTSLSLDGSDAMNKDADYSAAYVVLRTDDPGLAGHGFTFTIGRGNDVCVLAAEHRAAPLIGRDVAELAFAGGIVLYEIADEASSLEDVFMNLTTTTEAQEAIR